MDIAAKVPHEASTALLRFVKTDLLIAVAPSAAACVAVLLTAVVHSAEAVVHSAEATAVVPSAEAVVHSAEATAVPAEVVSEVAVDAPLEAATVTEDVVKTRTSAFIIRCTSLIEHDA